ncbi:26937_t:CDS:2, partial [Racocetra persica]
MSTSIWHGSLSIHQIYLALVENPPNCPNCVRNIRPIRINPELTKFVAKIVELKQAVKENVENAKLKDAESNARIVELE